ncbi:MAG: hypothetical protein GJU76_05245 [Gallionella sp.]|jgi:hypothetical protein|nr:hypothetical protein [Gallionella sp.]
MPTYDTHTKQYTDEPARRATAPAPSVNDVNGPRIDVPRAVSAWNERKAALKAAAADPTNQRQRIAAAELASMERAEPLQFKQLGIGK